MPHISLSKKLASAKRSPSERKGIHSWHPYYAGYSEAFVTSAIEYLGINKSHILLDPWHGSGTTALVASRYKLQTIGCEINPIMNIFSAAKSGFLIGKSKFIEKLSKEIEDRVLDSLSEDQDDDSLLDFMSESLSRGIRTLYVALNSYKYPQAPLESRLFNLFEEIPLFLNPFEAFFKSALFITARKLAGYKGGSNPTWVKTIENKAEYCIEDIVSEWLRVVDLMIHDLDSAVIPKLENIIHLPLSIDSRNLCIHSNSIDGIITSPPYLTRIDYAMSTRPELLIISNSFFLRSIREKTIGAPVIVDKSIKVNSIWGETCLAILDQVETHSSKAARSYYLPNMLQYFRDVELSLRECIRVLKPKSQALIVVQSSYFKEHEIDLGQIYTEICRNLGTQCEIVNREVVRGHMAHVNTKSSLYKNDKIYYEDVVCITK
ncbi:MAG: site-specific DNA-methyltransferase [Leptolyngbyaceae cyanobacterium SU_3_3]|nr:site-specific DNA-methyltransferase [Leptolyngbyaceae cyanobacterium SU_3_3]